MLRGYFEASSPAGVGPFRQDAQAVLERIDAGLRGALVDEALDEEAVRVVPGRAVLPREDVCIERGRLDAHVGDDALHVRWILHAEHHGLSRGHVRYESVGQAIGSQGRAQVDRLQIAILALAERLLARP